MAGVAVFVAGEYWQLYGSYVQFVQYLVVLCAKRGEAFGTFLGEHVRVDGTKEDGQLGTAFLQDGA